ncbi:hypothetical protein AAV35_006375 [Salimicrobium jeotgali]|uniref:GRAM domain-containing protein n=2 Tax=Salimicrobium TaxID=351195 RepID=K2FP82_9BACI|nr:MULTISPECIES: GRAM domain-containing protein [Salimicrobium]AKG04447.1 hypothetical protein AAV35_006375 [Salimicrobium jeotgali]EKE32651.1 hypothetical protein MJ3_01797 [Salimicrobium jeotgali]MBM7695366.1 hypothetical protein [Salimicrobium jeotgali]PBB05416.1 hypothetical protein CKW00_08460 [Salimicrobium humidisoli]
MPPIEEGENSIDLGANLKRGLEYVGGRLKITNEKLYFYPHFLNIQKRKLVIAINEIKTVNKGRILGISPNGVVIHLKDGTSHKFTIGMPWSNKKAEIINYIDSLIA